MQWNLEVYLNGTPLTFIADYWGSPNVTHRRSGPWELSWEMGGSQYFRHPDLVRGATVQLRHGPTPIWAGELTEPNFETQQFSAIGLPRQAEDAAALDFGAITTNPKQAVNWAILRGKLDWSAFHSLPDVPFVSGETQQFNSVAALLDAWSLSQNLTWRVDARGYVQALAQPTTPTYVITPGVGVLGVADEDYFADVYARYQTTSYGYATVEAHSGDSGPDRLIDLTGRGPLTSTAAQAIIDNLMSQGRSRTGWTNGIEVSHGDVLTPGGTPVALSEVRAGQMVRLLGLYDERGASAFTDVVLDETVWNVTGGTVQLKPVGLAARDLSSIVESVGGSLL